MKDIGLGIIVPTAFLAKYAVASPYHLVLTHMVFEAKMDKTAEYRDFYRRRSAEGDYLTLDNSSFEVGDGVYTNADLVHAATLVGAHEIMAPETYLDAYDTYRKVAEFREYFVKNRLRGKGFKIFATLHGKTIQDIIWLYRKFLSMKIDTIGISCRLDPEFYCHWSKPMALEQEAFRRSMVRHQIVRALVPHFNQFGRRTKHHLLGMNFPAEISWYKDLEMVRSCDSSAVFMNGLNENGIDNFNYIKPTEKIDFDRGAVTTHQDAMIQYNIGLLKEWGKRDDN